MGANPLLRTIKHSAINMDRVIILIDVVKKQPAFSAEKVIPG
jgi:hypothetical protein